MLREFVEGSANVFPDHFMRRTIAAFVLVLVCAGLLAPTASAGITAYRHSCCPEASEHHSCCPDEMSAAAPQAQQSAIRTALPSCCTRPLVTVAPQRASRPAPSVPVGASYDAHPILTEFAPLLETDPSPGALKSRAPPASSEAE